MWWRAWYDDGSVYDSSRHRTTDLPLDGALIFMKENGRGREILQGMDFYHVSPDGEVWGSAMAGEYPPGDVATVTAAIQARYPGARVIRGRTTSTAAYARIQSLAYASGRPGS